MTTIPLDNRALRTILRRIGACHVARQWAHNLDLRTAWMTCERGNWLLRLAAQLGVDRKRVVQATCQCARLELDLLSTSSPRPRQMIETAEAWCRGEATKEQVRSSSLNVAADADTAAYSAARAAFVNAYDLVYEVDYAVTHVANTAAYYANGNPGFNADEVARKNTLRECADLVRQTIPYRSIAAAARRMLRQRNRPAA